MRDFPLEEVFRRIDLIAAHYGPGTDVQVTGGEPTLRRRDELVAIVRRLAQKGLRASLFTNGIKATRELLAELANAGLTDVAFYVDTTQQRAGYRSESDLNALRGEYMAISAHPPKLPNQPGRRRSRRRGCAASLASDRGPTRRPFQPLPQLSAQGVTSAARPRRGDVAI